MTALEAQPEEKGKQWEKTLMERTGLCAAWAVGQVGSIASIRQLCARGPCIGQTWHRVSVLVFMGQMSHIAGLPGLPHYCLMVGV